MYVDRTRFGDNTLGLPETTDSATTTQFEVVKGLCQQAQPVFASATSASSVITPEQINTVVKLNILLLNEMNKAVGMHE